MIETTVNLINAGLMAYILYLIFDSIATQKRSLWLRIAIYVSGFLFMAAVLTFVPMGIIRTALMALTPLIVSFGYKLKWYNHIIIPLIIFGTFVGTELITAPIIMLVFSVSADAAVQGIYRIIGIIMSKIMMAFIICIVRIMKCRIPYSLNFGKMLTLLIVPANTIIISCMQISMFPRIAADSGEALPANIISYAIMIISNIAVFHLLDSSYRNAEKEKRLSIVTELLQAQTVQVEELQKHSTAVMKMRHDQKNYMLGILSELENGNGEAVISSLKNQLSMLDGKDLPFGNSTVYSVIKSKSEYANQYGITIDYNCNETDKLKISAIDIAIILGSALDNAVEAARNADGKTITVVSKINKNIIVMVIRNSVCADVDVNNLVSAKRNDGTMGFGIAAMKELAKKHGGEIIMNCRNKVFETTIILRNGDE